MSLIYKVDRGTDVSVPKTVRRLGNYHEPLPLVPLKRSKRLPDREASLFDRLRRGSKIPNPKTHIIDHDRSDRIQTDEHGMKIRLSDEHGMKIRLSDEAKGDLAVAQKPMLDVIKSASDAQIAALADVVGVPVTNEINKVRTDMDTMFRDIQRGFLTPSLDQQKQILDILSNPPAPAPAPVIAPSPVVDDEKKNVFSDDTWQSMSRIERTSTLKAAAARYIKEKKVPITSKIRFKSQYHSDANKMNDSWRFISNNNKLITIGTVRAKMKTGRYTLDLNNFTITTL